MTLIGRQQRRRCTQIVTRYETESPDLARFNRTSVESSRSICYSVEGHDRTLGTRQQPFAQRLEQQAEGADGANALDAGDAADDPLVGQQQIGLHPQGKRENGVIVAAHPECEPPRAFERSSSICYDSYMPRYIEISLRRRGVTCVAALLDDRAPRTCHAVWEALPQEGDVYHAKYAGNEFYTLVPAFPAEPLGIENGTIVPARGDVGYLHLPAGVRLPADARQALGGQAAVDLAVFYDRNNILLSPSEGYLPCNVFATIVRNLDQVTAAGNDIWRAGAVGERLCFRRMEQTSLERWALT